MIASNKEEAARTVTTLKRLLRDKGLHYAQVAEALDVSERTVQRWLSGDGLTLDLLAQLCALTGVSLAELFAIADRAVDDRPRRLTQEQEQALVDAPLRAFLFSRLLQGWSAKALQTACNLDEAHLVSHLLRLERIGLIELHPGNRVRLLTQRNIDWRKGGPMRTHFDQFAKRLVTEMQFGEAASIWTSEAVHLSLGSAATLDSRLQELRLEIRRLADTERDLPPEEKHWYSLLFMAFRHDLSRAEDPLGWAFSSMQ